MVRGLEQFVCSPDFDEFASIHYRDPISEEPDDVEVMGDKYVADTELLLYVCEKRKDSRLCGHIESGHWLIKHDYIGVVCNSSGESDALYLAAGEFLRIPVSDFWREINTAQQLSNLVKTDAM
ncbi:hypothetical protein AMS69_14965 [Haloarcula rubripromontorii]|uniref:Uncharacterized protein n=1 Tax=Haloarcula rubripromontorii TaxID=1705562 RepID=A0A0M9AJC8_9EURY|nr:hypothetical protein AMS69_14965 [Haloarcula rubripromontorii]